MANLRPVSPKLSSFGNSFADWDGQDIRSGRPKGDIDRDKLNATTMVDGIEFTKFDETIKDFILARLGFPVVRVELTPYQIKTCIDEAASRLHFHAPLWAKQFAVFDASAGYNLYQLPSYILDNISYVVFKKTLLSIQSQAGTLEFDFFIKYFQDNFLFQNFGVGDFYLLQQNLEQTRKILGQEGAWEVLNNKYLQLTPTPVVTPEPVIVEYRAIDSDTIHPAYRNWIQRFALACAKGVLGEIRGKYKTVPGPGGGAQLNGFELVQQSMTEKQTLLEELIAEFEEPPCFSTF